MTTTPNDPTTALPGRPKRVPAPLETGCRIELSWELISSRTHREFLK